MLPSYVDEKLNAYFKVSSEDRRALLKEELFDDNPLVCDERYLPFLALEVGCEIDDLGVDKQREAIVNATNELKRAGTLSYLKNNLKADIKNEVVELDNFHFRVDLMPEDANERFDERRFSAIEKRVERFKNVRSVFDGVNFKLLFDESVNISSATAINTKCDLDATHESKSKTDIKVATARVVRAQVNQNAKIDKSYIDTVHVSSASSFSTKCEKSALFKRDIEIKIDNSQFLFFNPTLQKEAIIDTTCNGVNKIQGAMTWQV